jgi:hypothetical protein
MARQRDLYQILNDHETSLHGLKATLARVAGAAVTDHGALTGLGDDDHTQYYNAARHTAAVHDALAMDHGALSGKGDDDHTQYLLVDGTRAPTGNLDFPLEKGPSVAMDGGDGGKLVLNSTGADLFNMYWSDGPDDGSEATLRIFGNNTDFLHLNLLDGDLDVGGQINPTGDIVWGQAIKPRIVMDSTGSGDAWSSQGAHIVMGEQAALGDSAAAALHLTYNGGGLAYIGMGVLDSTGEPAHGIEFRYTVDGSYSIGNGSITNPAWGYATDLDTGFYLIANGRHGVTANGVKCGEFGAYSGTNSGYFNVRWGDGFVSRPAYSFFNDIDTGMYLFGTNELGLAAGGGDNLLVGTYGIKINTSKDILPRSDNSSQLGASGARYIDVWAVDTSINSSDEEGKKYIAPMHQHLDASRFVADLEPVKFVRKGRSRKHMGWTAQAVKAAMDSQGVDWGAYIDPTVGGVPEGKREEDGFGVGPKGLRQGELLPVLWQAVRESQIEIAALKGRVAVLEAAGS